MKKIYLLFISITFLFSFDDKNGFMMQDDSYITGDDGVIRMYVNVIGHVKNPGTYLLYDKIDLMSAISVAGGYLPGSNLKKISIFSKNGDNNKINLDKILSTDSSIDKIVNLKPHDTIFIEQKAMHKFFMSSNLPSMILSFITLAITLEDKNGN